MPNLLAATSNQIDWEPRPKDIKSYFHFDAKIDKDRLRQLATDNAFVASHGFMPLIRFREKWIKFRKNGAKKLKSRPIRYCNRLDAGIYAYHRFKLSKEYERYLSKKGISEIPIAYRKIPKSTGGNKSNIEFAKDAFDFIRDVEECDVTVIDISSFFENLDHQRLKDSWEKVLGRPLDKAEESVFRSITNYSVVDIGPLYNRLSLFEHSGTSAREKRLRNIDKLKKSHKKRIANHKEFLDLVCGENSKYPSLIQKHNLPRGIPQGTPISDILANVYLIDFDLKLARWIRKKNGFACRYSDDIIIVIPKSENLRFDSAFLYLEQLLKGFDKELKIKPEKIAIGRYLGSSPNQLYTHIMGNSCQNGIEYLGFQFDGKVVQLRNSTLSNAWRKLKKRSHGWAKQWVKRYRNKGDSWLINNAQLDDRATEVLRTMSVPQAKAAGMKDWTFISYVNRANSTFKDYDTNFDKQTKKYRKKTISIYKDALYESVERNGATAFKKKGGIL